MSCELVSFLFFVPSHPPQTLTSAGQKSVTHLCSCVLLVEKIAMKLYLAQDGIQHHKIIIGRCVYLRLDDLIYYEAVQPYVIYFLITYSA